MPAVIQINYISIVQSKQQTIRRYNTMYKYGSMLSNFTKCQLCYGNIALGREKVVICPHCFKENTLTMYHLSCLKEFANENFKATCIICGNEIDILTIENILSKEDDENE